MRRLLVMALLASFPSGVTAGEPEGQGYGLGVHSCAEFASAYKAQPAIAENLYFAWAEGFMSGLNLSAAANNRPSRRLASINMESAKIQIRDYCDGHPLSQYAGAVVLIYGGLPALPANSK